jgi:hypothetical protein
MPKKKCDHIWEDVSELPVPESVVGRKYLLQSCSECGAEQVIRLEEKRIRIVNARPGPDVYLKAAYMDLAYILSQYDDKDVSEEYEGRNPRPLLEIAVDFCDRYIQINGGKRIKME